MQNLVSPEQETSNVEPSISDICPATGLPVIHRPEWTDVHFGKTYRATIRIIGASILWVQASGSVTLSEAEESLKLTQQVLTETITDNRPYVRINDWSDLKGFSLKARKCFVAYLKKCEALSGMIFYGASPISRMGIKLANRLNIFKFDAYIVDTYSEAVNLALEILSRVAPTEDKLIEAASGKTSFVQDALPADQKSICHVTGLPITTRPEWTDVHFGKDFRVTVSTIGDGIVWIQPFGYATLHDTEKLLELTLQVTTEALAEERPYVHISDWSNLRGTSLDGRKCFIENMKKRERIRGVIYYGVSPMLKLSINIGKRLNLVKFDVDIVKNYSEAVTLALKKLSHGTPAEDQTVKAACNQKNIVKTVLPTNIESICHVTGLPIIAKPEWTDIDVAKDYSVSFSIIGNAILCTAPRGIPGAVGIRKQIEVREKVLRSANLWGKRYAELRDYRGLDGKPPKESRLMLTELVLKEANDGNLLGFWVYNTPLAVKWMFNVGAKLFPSPAHVAAVADYKTAVENAVKVLEERGIDAGARQYSRFTKDDWSLELEDYGISFELIGDDIIYTITYGTLKEAYVDQFFNLCQKVLDEAGLTAKGYYYRILNWEKFERPSWKARKMYIARFKEFNQKVACKCSVVFGLNTFSRTMIAISKSLVHFPIVTAKNLDDALVIIKTEKSKSSQIEIARKEVKPASKIYSEEQIRGYSDDLLEFMGFINWDKQGVANEPVIDSHPFKALFDAIAIIKGDVDDLLQERRLAEETLRESEEKHRTILENIEQGYYEFDHTGSFTFFNDSMCKILGYSREELTGMNNRQYMDPEDAAKAYQVFSRVYSTGEPETGFVCEFTRKDGVKRQLGFSISLMKDSEGRKTGFRGIAGDITERKILQIQMLQAQKMESVGHLAAGIAHEVNTPTQYVSDNTHFIQEAFGHIIPILNKYDALLKAVKAGAVPENLVEEVESALEDADIDYFITEIPLALRQSLEGLNRTTDIIIAMKEFSHPGTKEKVPVDINKAIQSTITVARNEWKYVADIQTDFDATLAPVPCLASEFNQTILNLIVNAANAIADIVGVGSEEKGTITVSTRRVDHWVEIRIADTGAGITESIRPKIFDPFFTTKAIGKGTGQGLAISYAIIVKKHNGTIRFETEVGKGTTFIIRLPIDNEKH